jgi:hypothetical protein
LGISPADFKKPHRNSERQYLAKREDWEFLHTPMQGSIFYSPPPRRLLTDPNSPPTPICKKAPYIIIRHGRKKNVPKTTDSEGAIDYLCNKSPEVITPSKVSYEAQEAKAERLRETLLEENSMTEEDDEAERKFDLALLAKFKGRKLNFETLTKKQVEPTHAKALNSGIETPFLVSVTVPKQ